MKSKIRFMLLSWLLLGIYFSPLFAQDDLLYAEAETNLSPPSKSMNETIFLSPAQIQLIEPSYEQGEIYIEWSHQEDIPIGVSYQISIFDAEAPQTPIVKRKVYDTHLTIRDVYTHFAFGEKYGVEVLTAEQSKDYDLLNSGKSAASYFTFEPECITPINPVIDSYNHSEINISWLEPAEDAENYFYQLRYLVYDQEGASTEEKIESIPAGKSKYSIQNIQEGYDYRLQMRRICQEGDNQFESEWVNVGNVEIPKLAEEAYPEVCNSLTNLAVNNVSQTSVSLSWSGLTSYSTQWVGPYPIIYEIKYKNIFGNWNYQLLGSVNSHVLQNLSHNSTYEIGIRAIVKITDVQARWQYCEWDEFQTVNTLSFNDLCQDLNNVQTAGVGQNSVLLSWNGPTQYQSGGQTVGINYEIAYIKSGDPSWNSITAIMTNSFTVNGLETNSTYNFKIRMVSANFSFTCDWQILGQITTQSNTASLCTELTDIDFSSIGERSVTVNWNGPTSYQNGNNTVPVSYLVRYRKVESGSWISVNAGATNSVVIEPLDPNSTYMFEVQMLPSGSDGCAWQDGGQVTTTNLGALCETIGEPAIREVGGTYVILSWDGPTEHEFLGEPQPVNYELRYRTIGGEWVTVFAGAVNEFHIDDLEINTTYEVEVRMIPCCVEGFACPWVYIGEFTTTGVSLPEFECGQEAEPYELNSVDPLPSASIGDIFFINGFPLLLEAVSGGNGDFSGSGIIPLPFGSQEVKVEFAGVKVNKNRQIYKGQVIASADDPANYPELSFPPILLDNEICKPPVSEPGFDSNGVYQPDGTLHDPNGFDVNGNYILTPCDPNQSGITCNPQYDPNGFGADGNHIDTGTPFNPEGCNQQGLDANGQQCNPSGGCPYYWMQDCNTAPTEAGQNFANQVAPELNGIVTQVLNEFLTNTNDSIHLQQSQCGGIKNQMLGHVNTLGYTPELDLIAGENNQFFNEDMSNNFTEAPQERIVNTDLSVEQEQLEQKNIELYHCDKKLVTLKNFKTIILEQQQSGPINASVERLLETLRQLDEATVNTLNNPDSLYQWVLNQLGEDIIQIYEAEFGSLTDNAPQQFHDIAANITRRVLLNKRNNLNPYWERQSLNTTQWLTDKDNSALSGILKETGITQEEVAFQFKQGWEYIGGVHRAYYLEHFSKYQNLFQVQNGSSGNLLPLKISKQVLGKDYVLYIDNIVFDAGGNTDFFCTMDVYCVIEDPSSGKKMAFQALGVPFGTTGAIDPPRLELASEFAEIRLNNSAKLIINGTTDTYIDWDCEGFAGMGIDAEVEFCRNYFLPVDMDTETIIEDPERVRAYFKVAMPAWGEFLVSDITMDPFAITKAEDIFWEIEEMVFDFSSTETPTNVVVPDNYPSPYTTNNSLGHKWKGFYCKKLAATLPKNLTGLDSQGGNSCSTGNNNNDRVRIAVENVLIDSWGFTGLASVENILHLNNGNLGGWAFSIDEFRIGVVANKITGAGFDGLVHVPLLSSTNDQSQCVTEADCLGYSALIMPGSKYQFSVSPNQNYKVPLWVADATIDSTSMVTILKDAGGFKASAKLNGKMSFSESNVGINIPDIPFEGVEISTRSPHFNPGFWGVPGEVSAEFSGFAITFDSISVGETNVPDEVGISFRTLLELSPGAGELTAEGKFELIGYLDDSGGRQRWKYRKFKVNSFYLEGSFPSVEKVYGYIDFFEEDQNPAYGKGFRGMVGAKFSGIGAEIQAMAMFGKMPSQNYKYFMIDAFATFDPGIEMGGLQLLGFGGGVYNNMFRTGNTALSAAPNSNSNIPPLGTSLSGLVYVPSQSAGLGLKASVAFAAGNKALFSGNASFEVIFNDGGGLKSIAFLGNARFMSPPDVAAATTSGTGKPNNGASVNAYIDIAYIPADKTLDANFSVYVDALNAVKGAGPNGLFSETVLHFSPNKWFIKMGTPSKRNGLTLSIPGLTNLGTLESYLNVGTELDPMPPLPANVQELTGAGYFLTSESMRASGNGIAFGASLNFDTGEKEFLMFYGRFAVGAGFDVMLQQYEGATCAETGSTIGINGWYAAGQMYAFVEGKIGIKAKLFGKTRRFQILTIGAAAALQAKFPNPFWAKGAVGGRFSLLGGLIKGNCNFEVTIGESCTIIGASDPVSNIEIISQVIPVDGMQIDVTAQPQVTFNLPINQTFHLTDIDGNLEAFEASVEVECTSSTGLPIQGVMEFDADNISMIFKPHDMLPSNDSITFIVKGYIKQDGELLSEEIITHKYYTGEGYDHIPAMNVKAAYPFKGQYNFYRKEYNLKRGYILLNIGQPDLFYNIPEGMKLRLEILKEAKPIYYTPVVYSPSLRKVSYELPPEILENNQGYYARLRYLPNGHSESIHQGGTANSGNGGNNSGGGNDTATTVSSMFTPNPPNVNTNPPSNDPPVSGDSAPATNLYNLYFRTSHFDTFRDKMQHFKANTTIGTAQNDYQLVFNYQDDEGFDVFTDAEKSLISVEAVDNNNTWFADVKTDLYSAFPGQVSVGSLGWTDLDFSRSDELGLPMPLKAVSFEGEENLLNAASGLTGNIVGPSLRTTKLFSNVGIETDKDWKDIRQQLNQWLGSLEWTLMGYSPAVDLYQDEHLSDAAKAIKGGNAPKPASGLYKFVARYTLPGDVRTTSTVIELQK